MTGSDLPFMLGAVLGSLAVVHLFLLIAGVRFGTWRHVLSAYLVALIVTVFVSAAGDADGGAPNYQSAPARTLGVLIAFFIDLVLLKFRVRAEKRGG
jgi:hypothetical protein